MSTNYHTPVVGGEAVDAASVNTRFGDLDSAISGIAGGGSGIALFNLGTPTNTTLSGDAFTKVTTRHRLDTEGLAASDTLNNINSGIEGDIVYIQNSDATRIIYIQPGAGNIYTKSGSVLVLDDPQKIAGFVYSSLGWRELGVFRINTIGGVISVTLATGQANITDTNWMNIRLDTEGGAAFDDCDSILVNGTTVPGMDGQKIYVRITASSRIIRLRHNIGNLLLAGKQSLVIDNTNQTVEFVYMASVSKWCEVAQNFAMKSTSLQGLTNPVITFNDIPVALASGVMNSVRIKFVSGVVQADGVAAPTILGTQSVSNQAESTFSNFLSGAVAGNQGGFNTVAFNILRKQYDPEFYAVIKTGAAADIGNIRIYIGLAAALPTNVDTLVTSFLGFRYSTVAADAGWLPVASDGVSQVTGTAISGGGVGGILTTTTKYFLSMKVNNTTGVVTFRVNNGEALGQNINFGSLPVPTTDLGIVCMIITTAALAKNMLISRVGVQFT